MPGEFLPPVIAKLEADIADFESSMAEAQGTLSGLQDAIDSLHGKLIEFQTNADEATAQVAALGSAIDALPDHKTVVIDVEFAGAGGGAGGGDGGGGLAAGGDGGGGGFGKFLAGLLFGKGGRLGVGRFGVGLPIAQASLLGMAGLGPLELAAAGLGVGVSGAGALAGGAIMGAGALGTSAVGMGSDLLVMQDTSKEVKNLTGLMDKLSAAQAAFGANSRQATQAQQQLNGAIQQLAGSSGPQAALAILMTANHVQNLKDRFDQLTGQAKIAATGIMNQFLDLADAVLPHVADAANKNLSIIGQAIKPFMSWLATDGMVIFDHLENIFAARLPTAVHAAGQGMELFLRTVDLAASHLTGNLTRSIDQFLTRMNTTGWSKWSGEVERLIGLFHTWEAFLKVIAQDIYQIFHADAGTGTAIIQTLTGMLERLHAYLQSAQGHDALHNVFEAHKQAILALLQVLPGLVESLGRLELTVVPGLARALADVLTVLTPLINLLASNPVTGFALGLFLIAGKMAGFGTVIRAVAAAFGFLRTALFTTSAAQAMAALTAGELATSETAAGASAARAGGIFAALGGALARIGAIASTIGAAFTSTAGLIAAAVVGIVVGLTAIVAPIVAWGKNVGAVMNQVIRGALGPLGAAFAGLWSGIYQGLQTAGSAIVNFFGHTLPSAMQTASSGFQAGIAAIGGALSSFVGMVASGVSAAVSFLASLPGRAVGAISALPGMLAGLASSAMSSMASAVSGGIGAVISFFASLPGRIMGILSGLPGEMASLGESIVAGLAHGIESAGSSLIGGAFDHLKGLVSSGIGAIKSLIGSHSPSRVFMDIGKSIPEGLALGIQNDLRLVGSALDLVGLAIGGGARSSSAAAKLASTIPGAFGNASGQPIVINQTLNLSGVSASPENQAVFSSGLKDSNAEMVRQIRALVGHA